MQGFQNFIARTWGSGKRGKIGIGCAALVFLCATCVVGAQIYSATPQGQASATAAAHNSFSTATAQAVSLNATRDAGAERTRAALAAAADARLTEAAKPTNTVAPTSTNAPPTKTLAPDGALVARAREKFGDEFMTAHLADVLGKNYATVDYDLGLQWDENSAVFDARQNFITFAPVVFEIATIDALELRAFTDFKDALGNSKKEVALKFTLQRALAEKINWKGIDPARLEAALATQEGNGVYVHPALRAAWNASQK